MKRVFLIHGWGGSPQEGWRPWLKKELENMKHFSGDNGIMELPVVLDKLLEISIR